MNRGRQSKSVERMAGRQATWFGRAPARAIRGEDGASLVEFALVLPVFALLLFAMIDFGLVFGGFITLRNGVEAGARLASVDQYTYTGSGCPSSTDPTTEMVCNIANRIGSMTGTSSGTLKIGIMYNTGNVDDNVTVCANVGLHATTGLTAPFLNGRTMSSTSTIRLEQAAKYGTFTSGQSITFGGQTITGMTCS